MKLLNETKRTSHTASLSLGFFKLALEAGCQNVELLKDELKSFVCRHNLLGLAESAKEVPQSYEISESIEQLQVSKTCSHVPGDDDARGACRGARSAAKTSAIEATQKSKAPMVKNQKAVTETGNDKMQKNLKKPSKQESKKEKQMVKTEAMKPAKEEALSATVPKEVVLEDNKENMDAPLVEEISLQA